MVEVGPGLGSLTLALAETGAEVVALEVDPALLPALEEVLAPFDRVRVELGDAMTADWRALLPGEGPWSMVANLPYNVAVPVVMRVLEEEPRVRRLVVMVQREVGERLAAGPGDPEFGAVSLRVAYRAEARVIRRVARTVFWPMPSVESVLVGLVRRPPPVDAEPAALFELIRVAFGERRKTIRNALIRSGLDAGGAARALAAGGVEPATRPEQLGLESFAALSEAARAVRAGVGERSTGPRAGPS